jgi:glucose-1-phosphate thymidylyltransferase
MQILLPIAGLGTRVRPHTHVRPKPMLTLAGKPVLGHLLDYLMQLQPSSIVLVVGERGHVIERYVREHYTVPFHIRVQQQLSGQSHAVKMAEDVLTEPTLIVFGDTLFDAPLDQLTDASIDGAIAVQPVPDPSRFGVIELKDGYVSRLVEKPVDAASNLATIGVYMINDPAALFAAIDAQIAAGDALKGEFFLAGALQRLFDAGARFRPVTATGWYDTGTIEAVLDTHRHLLRSSHTEPHDTNEALLIPPCYVDPSARLERSIVGPYVSIGPGASVRECVLSDTIVGLGAQVRGQVLRRSIIGDQAELMSGPLSVNVSDHSSLRPLGADQP